MFEKEVFGFLHKTAAGDELFNLFAAVEAYHLHLTQFFRFFAVGLRFNEEVDFFVGAAGQQRQLFTFVQAAFGDDKHNDVMIAAHNQVVFGEHGNPVAVDVADDGLFTAAPDDIPLGILGHVMTFEVLHHGVVFAVSEKQRNCPARVCGAFEHGIHQLRAIGTENFYLCRFFQAISFDIEQAGFGYPSFNQLFFGLGAETVVYDVSHQLFGFGGTDKLLFLIQIFEFHNLRAAYFTLRALLVDK